MSLKLGTLFYDIEADTGGLKKAEGQVSQSNARMSKSFAKLGTVVAAAVSVATITKITMLADELRVAERRIEVISSSTFEFNKNLSNLKKTANDTGLQFKSVFSVFEGFKRIQDDIGATDDEILQFTDSLAKLGNIGGSSQEELSNALRQLNQGLAGGILRAEEFNSIVENTPEIAQAIAKGLGKSVGELRQMVLDGELLADDVFGAILSQSDAVNERFEKTPRSLKSLFQESSNLLVDIIGNLDKMTRFTGFLGEKWDAFNEVLEKVAINTKQINDLSLEQAKEREQSLINEAKLLQDQITPLRQRLDVLREEGAMSSTSFIVKNEIFELEKEYLSVVEEAAEVQSHIVELQKQQNEQATVTNEKINETKGVYIELADLVTSGSFDISNFMGPEALEAMKAAADEAQRLKDTVSELAEFDDAFAQMEEDAENFTEIVKEANEEALLDSLEKAQESADAWAGAFGGIAQVAKNLRKKEEQEAIDAVNKRKDLSEKEKKEAIKNLKERYSEESKAEKLALIAERAAALASIAINTSRNVIKAGGILSPGGAIELAFGLTQAAVVASTPLGGGRNFGGEVAPGMLTPVNENGDPEMLAIGNKQYLLTGDKGGRITSGANMESGGDGLKVVINNSAPGAEARVQYVTKQELIIAVEAAENNAVSKVNKSIRSGQGTTARALRASGSRN